MKDKPPSRNAVGKKKSQPTRKLSFPLRVRAQLGRAMDRLLGYRLRYGKENWRAAAAWVEGLRPAEVRLVPDYLSLAFDRYYEPYPGPPPRLAWNARG